MPSPCATTYLFSIYIATPILTRIFRPLQRFTQEPQTSHGSGGISRCTSTRNGRWVWSSVWTTAPVTPCPLPTLRYANTLLIYLWLLLIPLLSLVTVGGYEPVEQFGGNTSQHAQCTGHGTGATPDLLYYPLCFIKLLIHLFLCTGHGTGDLPCPKSITLHLCLTIHLIHLMSVYSLWYSLMSMDWKENDKLSY